MSTTHLYTYGEFALEYAVYGRGQKILLYFHGYGKSAAEFADYAMHLGSIYTVYSFSFFHHGRSTYPLHRIDRDTLSPSELTAMITAFLRDHGVKRFSLMGYSMGGKICLSLLTDLHQRIDQLILVAPDGIKKNFWYRFTSNNHLGNALYRKIIYQPRFFFFVIKTLKKTRLLNQRLYDFVSLHLETEEKRIQVYRVWMTLRRISPDRKLVARLIREQEINTSLHYGRYDRVIPLRQGEKFHARTQPFSHLHVLEKGHKMANAHTGEGIEAFLMEPCDFYH